MPYQPGDLLLDKYRIVKTLGQGAFGEVYLVTHTQLNVLRVVKVLRRDAPGMDAPQYYGKAQARFLLEAQLGARLNTPRPNPRLLQIHDSHIDENLSFLEMEYAAGGSLAERIQKNRAGNRLMPLDEALRMALEVAEGLAALHALDIVHRDVKPANILFDEEGQAHLGDLGLAQEPGGPSQRSQLSSPEPHPGTPAYMSPEQKDSREYLASATDIYSLGATLFEALTGRLYSGQRPGTRAASLRADLPAPLDDLLAKMLSEAPRARPWNGAEAAGLLRALLDAQARRLSRKKAQMEHQRLVREAGEKRKAEEQAAERDRLAREAEDKRRAEATAAEKSRTAAQQVERLASERVAAPVPKDLQQARLEAELRQFARLAQPEDKPGRGFLARFWPEIVLMVALVLLTGGYLIFNPVRLNLNPVSLLPAPTGTYGVGSTWTRPTDKMLMVYIPAGSFKMGSDKDGLDEKPVHTVTLDAYWMDKTEVTNAEYARCVAAGGCTAPPMNISATRANYYGVSNFDNYPVVYVDWNQAKSYCEWAGARLPTEAEWELAARGTDGRTYPWGNMLDTAYVNYGLKDTAEVCSYPQGNSPFGACDMAGYVWQWVADWYGSYPNTPVSNPLGPTTGSARVFRGGSSCYDSIISIRSTRRCSNRTTGNSDHLGFRCALGASPQGADSTAFTTITPGTVLSTDRTPLSTNDTPPAPTVNIALTTPSQFPPTGTSISPTGIFPLPTGTPLPSPIPTLLPGSTWLRPADGMLMLYVPGGTFTMGSTDFSDAAPHQVTLSPYWIDQTDVTNAEYAMCVKAGRCSAPSSIVSATHSDYYFNTRYAKYPFINVDKGQAEAYCSWAGQASNNVTVGLPTEAQWELAARGTDGRTYPWGEAIDKSYANYSGTDTTAVCSYPKGNSPYGACDMAGNVWQWVADWYAAYPGGPVSNPTGPAWSYSVSGPSSVLRGGSWNMLNDSVRSAYRDYYLYARSFTDGSIGFRCARSN